MEEAAINFTIFTLNCWGLRFLSKNRTERFCAIASHIRLSRYTFVLLQEVWTHSDYCLLQNMLKDVLPFSHYFESGTIGSGLCIFSKVPIMTSAFMPFLANGYFYKIWHGDWFSGKGVGVCRVTLEDRFTINLLTTHTHVETSGPEYAAHRLTQALCLVDTVNLCADAADLTILGGDLNCTPSGLLTQLVINATMLQDSFVTTDYVYSHPSLLENRDRSTNIDDIGATCGLPSNSYTPKSTIKTCPSGWRLDYVLYKAKKQSGDIRVLKYSRPLPNRAGGLTKPENFSYSDHEAIAVHFSFTPHSQNQNNHKTKGSKEAAESPINLLSVSTTPPISLSPVDTIATTLRDSPTLTPENNCNNDIRFPSLCSTVSSRSNPLRRRLIRLDGKDKCPYLLQPQLFETSLNVLNNSLEILRRRNFSCTGLGALLFLLLFSTVYLPPLNLAAAIIINLARIFFAILAFILAIVQPIHIYQEINTLKAARRSLVCKQLITCSGE